MTRRPSLSTMIRRHKKASTTTRGTPRQRKLDGEWFRLRYAMLKSTPYKQVEEAFITSVRRKSAPNREAILREMELQTGDALREYVLRTFASFRPSQR